MKTHSQGRGFHFIQAICLWLVSCLLISPGHSKELHHAWVFIDEDSSQYKATYDALIQTVDVAPLKLHKILPDSPLPPSQPDFVISIGSKATEKSFSIQTKAPKLAVLITESIFKQLATTHHHSLDAAFKANVSAIILEQPFLRYFLLGKNLIPNAKRVGLLISPNTRYRLLEAESVASALNLDLTIAHIDLTQNPVRSLEPVISQTDFFIVVPDTQAINQATARWILELSYRHSTPVIGYSARYAESGAIAGIFTPAESIGQQAGQWLLHALVSAPKQGQIIGPYDLRIALNPSVARTNNVVLKDSEYYRRRLLPNGGFQ